MVTRNRKVKYHTIYRYASETVDKLVVGNKSDQADKRKVSFEEGYEFARQFKLDFTEVSALNAENIGKAFEVIAKKVMKRLDSTPQIATKYPQKLEKKKEVTSNSCC